jgi:hypothetical protein
MSDSERDDSNQIQEPRDKETRKKTKTQRSHSISRGNESENDKKLKGKITTNENEEVVRVTWRIYC